MDDGDEGGEREVGDRARGDEENLTWSDNIFLESFVALPFADIELMSFSDHLVDEVRYVSLKESAIIPTYLPLCLAPLVSERRGRD